MFWDSVSKYTYTENGALTLNTTNSAVLDMFSMGGAMRSRTDKEIVALFRNAFKEDPVLAMKCLFYIRDCRGGLGEKRFFRVILKYLKDTYKDIPLDKVIKLTSEYGSWKDVFQTLNPPDYFSIVAPQFIKDASNGCPSMMEKYMPSIGGSANKKAEEFARLLKITPRQYRKTLSLLRGKLKLVETMLSEQKWDEIKYSAVPSKAMMKYNKAFGRHDYERFSEFIENVKKGTEKINASTLYPYEIYKSLKNGSIKDNEATALWDNLPDYTNGKNAIVMADVSGSMTWGDGLPILISVSLALYFAERNKGKFNGSFMTFSTNPEVVKVKGKTLSEKMNNISTARWSGTTDLQKAFDLILSAGLRDSIPQEEMPEVIYIISDMEFNTATRGSGIDKTNFDAIKEKYSNAGYTIPRVVFWNVNSHQDNVPVSKNELGVALVSGASPSVFKIAVDKDCSPEKILLNTLNSERYKAVEELFV